MPKKWPNGGQMVPNGGLGPCRRWIWHGLGATRCPIGAEYTHIGSLNQPLVGNVFYLSSSNVFLSLYRFNEMHFPLGAILMAGRWAILYGVAPETNGNGPGSSGGSSVPKVLGTGTPLP